MRPKIFLVTLLLPLLAAGIAHGQADKRPASLNEPSSPEAIKRFNEDRVIELSKQIAGKEDQPSETVFKNINILNGIPAGRLLGIMQIGLARSLGVSCTHCHAPGEWEKEVKPTKQIARDMWKMMHTINNDLLKNIEGLKDRKPIVNCTTCHRGHLKPALDLDTDGAEK